MASKTQKSNASAKNSIVNFANSTPNAKSMEDMMDTSKNNFEKFKTDATTSGKQGMDACMKSGQLFAQGMEQYIKTMVAIAQSSAERQSDAFKQLLTCKTLSEVTEAQNKIAQDNFEELMQTATKLSEITIKLATDVFEPINEEVSKNVRKATDSAAA